MLETSRISYLLRMICRVEDIIAGVIAIKMKKSCFSVDYRLKKKKTKG